MTMAANGALDIRVLQWPNAKGQKQGKKEEEEEEEEEEGEGGPLNRFTMIKTWPIRPT
jgi:hypothetical protein